MTWRPFHIVLAVTAALTAVLAVLLIQGLLAPRAFAFWELGAMIASAFMVSMLLRTKVVTSETGGGKVRPTQRFMKRPVLMAFLVIVLATSFWITRDGPWLPRLVGASMLMLFLIGKFFIKR
jgi:hypothetical protein